MAEEKWFKTHLWQLINMKAEDENRPVSEVIDALAAFSGVSPRMIGYYADNRMQRPTWFVVRKMCQFFDVPLMELIDEDESDRQRPHTLMYGAVPFVNASL
jgi:hypothetical protein